MSNETIETIIKKFRHMRLPIMADSLLNIIENGELDTRTTIDILDHLTS